MNAWVKRSSSDKQVMILTSSLMTTTVCIFMIKLSPVGKVSSAIKINTTVACVVMNKWLI